MFFFFFCFLFFVLFFCFFFQAEDGIRDLVRSRGLGDVYKRQGGFSTDLGGSCWQWYHGLGSEANAVRH